MPRDGRVDDLELALRWLGGLRWLAAGAAAGLILLLHFALGYRIAWGLPVCAAAGVGAYNLTFCLLFHRTRRKLDEARRLPRLRRLAAAEIALDLLALGFLLHFTGGVGSPFVILLLLPPVLASVVLGRFQVWVLGVLDIALFVAIGVGEILWPGLHHPLGERLPEGIHGGAFTVAVEAAALGVGVFVSALLLGKISSRLHQRLQGLDRDNNQLSKRKVELEEESRQLQQVEERRTRLLNLTAHQLRGPLAVTESCLATACEGWTTDPEKQTELLERARRRIQAMMQIVRDLLTLSSTHELSRASRWTLVSLDDVVGRVVDQYMDYAASRQVELVFSPSAGSARVMGSDRALTDAVGNLVSNAIKYSGEAGHVKVATRASGEEVVCEVIDDGIGIPEREKERLFQEFFRAANARAMEQEGTGLGLSIAKGIVEKHDGRLIIESLEHLGTCAVIVLPRSG